MYILTYDCRIIETEHVFEHNYECIECWKIECWKKVPFEKVGNGILYLVAPPWGQNMMIDAEYIFGTRLEAIEELKSVLEERLRYVDQEIIEEKGNES